MPTGDTLLYICDFSRGVLNTLFHARIQHLLRGYKYAFDDYLEFVDYNGTIDDMIDNNDFKYEYGCSISRSGDKLTFTYDEDYDIVCTLQLTEEAGYNWDGFELEENGDLKVT